MTNILDSLRGEKNAKFVDKMLAVRKQYRESVGKGQTIEDMEREAEIGKNELPFDDDECISFKEDEIYGAPYSVKEKSSCSQM
jgi:hypothetical protein